MSLKSILSQVDKLKAEFEALKPLKKEDEERLWKKFRLDWNYNSNHIEGNTLTYGETELLLIFGKTTGDHSIREYEEMQAHDVAIKQVQQAADDKERPLTEQFIRLLNETLLVKPFWKEAQTADGQDTRRQIIPGKYKEHPNSVRLENGELFHYAAPQDVPILMGDLITSYNQAVAEGKHPIEIAAMLHYKFVRIHPFDDGNGRVARLLMNYVLLNHSYQPAIIKTDAKKEYLTALNKTDVLNAEIEAINNIQPFAEYIANQLLWSYEISIKAAKGDSIIEEGDFEKRLKRLGKVLKDKKEIKIKLNNESRDYLLKFIIKDTLEELNKRISNLTSYFLSTSINVNLYEENSDIPIRIIHFKDINNIQSISNIKFTFGLGKIIEINKINILYNFNEFKKNGNKTFNVELYIGITLDQYSYTFSVFGDSEKKQFTAEKLLDEGLNSKELSLLTETFGNYILEAIEGKISK